MKVVLSILEILGWSLLVLLIVFLVLFILLLFCRLRYVAEGECLEEKWARFKAHWLFRLVRAKISYGDDLIYGEVHIFWKKITFSYDLSVKKEEVEDDAEEVVDDLETVSNESENQFAKKTSEIDKGFEENVLDSENQVLEEQKRVEEKVIGTETSFELRGETEPWSNATDEESSTETSFNKDVSKNEEGSDNARSESIISKIKGIIKRIKQIYLRLKKILTDEKNKDAVKHLKDEIVYLIKILLPKKSKIEDRKSVV